jgi:copper chaperone
MLGCCSGDRVRSDVTLKVDGMSCGHCKKAVETSVGVLPGIVKVEALVEKGKVNISFEPTKVRLQDIVKAIRDAGYDVKE